MKIGFVVNNPNPETGGGYTFESSILNALYQTNTDHEFFILSYQNSSSLNSDRKIKFIDLNEYSKTNNLNKIKRLTSKIFKKKKDTKLSPLNKAIKENQLEFIWFLTPPIGEIVNAPFVFTVWDLQHRLQPYFPELSNNWVGFENHYNEVLRRASYVITGNNTGKNEIERFYNIPPERIKTIALPTPDFVFKSQEKIHNYYIKEKFIFYPAQFWPHKNHVVILEALKILKEQDNIELSVVFTGSDKGNLSYLKKIVKELDLNDKVLFKGFVSTEELVYLYENAVAMVYPSFFGPDNLPPLEAMALNCPVVCTKNEGMLEQLGDTVLFFDNKNEEELAAILKEIYLNGYDEKLIKNGYKRALSWTSENYVSSMADLIDGFSKIRRCWDYLYTD